MTQSRRGFMTTAGAAIASAAVAPSAFAQWRPKRALSGSRGQDFRSKFWQIPAWAGERRAHRHRHALVRGAGLVRRRPLPGVERHSQQPHHEAARIRRVSVSASRRTTPTATPSIARAGSSPASTTRAGVTRTEHDGTITVLIDKFDGKRFNSPNDVVGQFRRFDLVHRSAVRHPRQLRGADGDAELPTNVYRFDPKTGRATVVVGDINRPNGLRPSRPTS